MGIMLKLLLLTHCLCHIHGKAVKISEDFLFENSLIHGHSVEERHGHSLEEIHELEKRKAPSSAEEQEKHGHSFEKQNEDEDIDLAIAQLGLSEERVEANPNPEANRVEEAEEKAQIKAMEAKMLADGDKAFEAFDQSINEAIKQSEAVEEEVRKDIDEQSEHRIQE